MMASIFYFIESFNKNNIIDLQYGNNLLARAESVGFKARDQSPIGTRRHYSALQMIIILSFIPPFFYTANNCGCHFTYI